MELKNMADYTDIWFQTEKAFNYLCRRGCDHYSDSVKTTVGGTFLICYHISGADQKMIKHVSNRYPRALIVFADPEVVQEENQRKRDAFFRYISNK